MISKMFIPLLLFSDLSAASESKLIDRLKKQSLQVQMVSGRIDIEKKSKFLKRPLLSKAKFTVTSDRIEWITLEPIKTISVLDRGHLTVDGKAVAGPQVAEFLPVFNQLSSMMRSDWSSIDKKFILSQEGENITIIPRLDTDKRYAEMIVISFDKNDKPRTIVLTSRSDITTMTVTSLENRPSKSATSP